MKSTTKFDKTCWTQNAMVRVIMKPCNMFFFFKMTKENFDQQSQNQLFTIVFTISIYFKILTWFTFWNKKGDERQKSSLRITIFFNFCMIYLRISIFVKGNCRSWSVFDSDQRYVWTIQVLLIKLTVMNNSYNLLCFNHFRHVPIYLVLE